VSRGAEGMGYGLDLSVHEAVRRVKDRNDPLTAVALVEESLRRIAERDGAVHAFLATTPDLARAQARAVDSAVERGDDPGPLAGMPLAVKDNLAVAGVPLTCASRILAGYLPPVEATAVARAVAAGACVVGKTNLDEFAMGSSTENSAFGPTKNPHDLACVPGGSSGGSAAAVAAGMVPLALGSDTGGSVRQPAALCGVVGLKPSYGRVSRSGLVAFASSLDQVGPFGRTVDEAARLLEAIAGPDPLDATSHAFPTAVRTGPSRGAAGLRIGIVNEFALGAAGHPEVEAALARARTALTGAGAKEVPLSIPLGGREGISIYYIVAPAEASSNLARFDGVRYGYRAAASDLPGLYAKTRGQGFGPEVRRRILIGTFVLSTGYADAFYKRAMSARAALREQFDAAFRRCDVLLSATTPTPAFRVGEKTDDPVQMYLCDVLTVVANLAGVPAISIPAGRSTDGLPIGLQLWAAHGRDDLLLDAAQAVEDVLAFPFRAAAPATSGAAR
jgi:aspartyl-tRNA(Asn)/glutamyl-tRNA(Gln) amidotransferase subunit A